MITPSIAIAFAIAMLDDEEIPPIEEQKEFEIGMKKTEVEYNLALLSEFYIHFEDKGEYNKWKYYTTFLHLANTL